MSIIVNATPRIVNNNKHYRKNKGRGKLLALLYLVVNFPRISYFVISAIKNIVKREVN